MITKEKKKRDLFFKANGDLTLYSFNCGYIERKKINNYEIDLSYESACYTVKVRLYDKKFNFGVSLVKWCNYEANELQKVRKDIKEVIKMIKKNKYSVKSYHEDNNLTKDKLLEV